MHFYSAECHLNADRPVVDVSYVPRLGVSVLRTPSRDSEKGEGKWRVRAWRVVDGSPAA